jgi:hypothetical protein
MLRKSLKKPLKEHLRRAKGVHEKHLANSWGRVQLPAGVLGQKRSNASRESAGNGSSHRGIGGQVHRNGMPGSRQKITLQKEALLNN